MLLALALAAAVKDDLAPPARYDHEYPGAVVVQMVHPRNVPSACRALFKAAGLEELGRSVRDDQMGCAVVWPARKRCKIIIIDRPSASGRTPEELARHERGHCNGWPSHHPN